LFDCFRLAGFDLVFAMVVSDSADGSSTSANLIVFGDAPALQVG
jgi:hypothetical protein